MQNLLPQDGVVHYYGTIISSDEADLYFTQLLNNIAWQQDQLVLFGKHITTKRKVAWYGDQPYAYTYSYKTKHALPWSPILLDIKNIIEKKANTSFNSCLLNLYHDGSEAMGWHSDNEKELKPSGDIASVSFGAERKFSFKHKVTKQTIGQVLEHGSLLMMKENTQSFWLHSLPKSKKIYKPRINLTFRTIINSC